MIYLFYVLFILIVRAEPFCFFLHMGDISKITTNWEVQLCKLNPDDYNVATICEIFKLSGNDLVNKLFHLAINCSPCGRRGFLCRPGSELCLIIGPYPVKLFRCIATPSVTNEYSPKWLPCNKVGCWVPDNHLLSIETCSLLRLPITNLRYRLVICSIYTENALSSPTCWIRNSSQPLEPLNIAMYKFKPTLRDMRDAANLCEEERVHVRQEEWWSKATAAIEKMMNHTEHGGALFNLDLMRWCSIRYSPTRSDFGRYRNILSKLSVRGLGAACNAVMSLQRYLAEHRCPYIQKRERLFASVIASFLCYDHLTRIGSIVHNTTISNPRSKRKKPQGRSLCGEIVSITLTGGEVCQIVPEMLNMTTLPTTWSFLACPLISLALDIKLESPGASEAYKWWSTFCSLVPKWIGIVRLNLADMNAAELIALQSRSHNTIPIIPRCSKFGEVHHYAKKDQESLCLDPLVFEIRFILKAVFDWKCINMSPKRNNTREV